MSYDQLFTLANGIALASWMLLILFPFRPLLHRVLPGVSVMLFCVAYVFLLQKVLKVDDFRQFATLQGVQSLFANPGAVLVGWLHYLAFDLMAGLFIAQNAAKHGIKYYWLIPCLLLTFMMGPVGLFLYFLLRWHFTRNYFADNY